jgi:hypothetical protein
MSSSRVFIGILLLTLGALGLADAAGWIDAGTLIAQWWPLVLVGWPLVDMIGERRLTLAGVICMAFGLTLLATAQDWTSDLVAWALLALFAGTAVLVAGMWKRAGGRDGKSGTPPALPGGVLS